MSRRPRVGQVRAFGPLVLTVLAVLWIGMAPSEPPPDPPPDEGQGFFGITFDMEPEGARVKAIIAGGAAEAAGLQAGDLVLSLGGKPLAGVTHLELHDLVAPYRVGEEVPVEVAREDRIFSVVLALGPTPPRFRTSSEARERLHAALFENDGLEQFFRLIRRAPVLELRREEGSEYSIRPQRDGAEWEPLHPFLISYLDRYLDGVASKLEPSHTVEISAVEEEAGVRMKVIGEPGKEN